MKNDELYNLCFSCLIDGGGEHMPMTEKEAADLISEWQEEGCELAEVEGLNAADLSEVWNQVFYQLHFGRR